MAAVAAKIPVEGKGALGARFDPSVVSEINPKRPAHKLRFVTLEKEERQGCALPTWDGAARGGRDEDEERKEKEEEDDIGQDDVGIQARRLYAALTYSSDNEREAYRRNKTEQTRLSMVLEHIGIQRTMRSKDLAKDISLMKVKNTRLEERLREVEMDSRTWTANSPRVLARRAVSNLSQLYRKDNRGDGGALELPDISSGHRHGISSMTAPGARVKGKPITFISESLDGDWEHRQLEETPRRAAGGSVFRSGNVKGNATRYPDTNTPKTPHSYPSSSNKLQGSGLPTPPYKTRGTAESVHQTRKTLEKVQLRQAKSQKQPLMAILSTSMYAGNKRRGKADDGTLDADIESVLNEENGARSSAPRRVGAPSGFGLRRPANFDITISQEDLGEEEETLRSLTSSARPDIDKLATPSSNAFRGEGMAVTTKRMGGWSSSAACIEMRVELQSRRRRRSDTHQLRQLARQGALMHEKNTMRHHEDKIEEFYKKLKGEKRGLGKKGNLKANHWDFRGEEEKLLFY